MTKKERKKFPEEAAIVTVVLTDKWHEKVAEKQKQYSLRTGRHLSKARAILKLIEEAQ